MSYGCSLIRYMICLLMFPDFYPIAGLEQSRFISQEPCTVMALKGSSLPHYVVPLYYVMELLACPCL